MPHTERLVKEANVKNELHFSFLIESDYQYIRQEIDGPITEDWFLTYRAAAAKHNWDEEFSIDTGDAVTCWMPVEWKGPKLPLGRMTFRWKGEKSLEGWDGLSDIDVLAYAFPRKNLPVEDTFIGDLKLDPEITKRLIRLGRNPNVFFLTKAANLTKQRRVTARDGNNRIQNRDSAYRYLMSSMGYLGMFWLERYWKINVFGDMPEDTK